MKKIKVESTGYLIAHAKHIKGANQIRWFIYSKYVGIYLIGRHTTISNAKFI